jgi:hypothetical protein
MHLMFHQRIYHFNFMCKKSLLKMSDVGDGFEGLMTTC